MTDVLSRLCALLGQGKNDTTSILLAIAIADAAGDSRGLWHAWPIAVVDGKNTALLEQIRSSADPSLPRNQWSFDILGDNVGIYLCKPRAGVASANDMYVALLDPYEVFDYGWPLWMKLARGPRQAPAEEPIVIDFAQLLRGR